MKPRLDIKRQVDAIVRRWSDGDTYTDIAKSYGCHWQVIRKYVREVLSPEFRNAVGTEHIRMQGLSHDHHFQPGQKPVVGYQAGCLRGAAARRHVRIGTIRLRYLSNNRGRKRPWYYSIKFKDDCWASSGNWKPVAVYIWEAKHGPVPDGWFVCHKDGNRLNHAYENLKVIPRSDLLRHARSVRPKRFAKKRISRAAKQAWRDRKNLRAAGIRRTI